MSSPARWPLLTVILVASLSVPASLRQEPPGLALLGCAWDHTTITIYVRTTGLSHDALAMAPQATQVAIRDWESAIRDARDVEGDSMADFDLVVVDREGDITVLLQGVILEDMGTAGYADVQCDEGRITHVDVVIIGEALWYGYDEILFGNLVRHEMGHALGLGHANFPGELMSPARIKDRAVGISACDVKAFATAHQWYPGAFVPPPAAFVSCE